jgi:hypothetical protein
MPRLNRDTTAEGTRKPKKLCLNENRQFRKRGIEWKSTFTKYESRK